jgi:hypothetical protein
VEDIVRAVRRSGASPEAHPRTAASPCTRQVLLLPLLYDKIQSAFVAQCLCLLAQYASNHDGQLRGNT